MTLSPPLERAVAPDSPAFGDEAAPARACPDTLALLAQRRSTVADQLAEPGPDDAQLDALLRLAARAPDHGKLAPWRFIVFAGAARAAAGEVLAHALQAAQPDASAEHVAREKARFTRAPLCVAVVSQPVVPHKIPEWEQILSAGAVCQNLLIAAHAMGYAGQWLTEWYAYDRTVLSAFGVQPGERVAGYVFLGSPAMTPMERRRPQTPALTTRWTGPAGTRAGTHTGVDG